MAEVEGVRIHSASDIEGRVVVTIRPEDIMLAKEGIAQQRSQRLQGKGNQHPGPGHIPGSFSGRVLSPFLMIRSTDLSTEGGTDDSHCSR